MSKELQVTDLLALFDLAKNEDKYAEKMKKLQDAEKRSEVILKIASTVEAAESIKQDAESILLQAQKDAEETQKFHEAKEEKLEKLYKQKEQELEQKYQLLKKEFEGTRELKKSLEQKEAELSEKDVQLAAWSQALSKQDATSRKISDTIKAKLSAMTKLWNE